MKSFIRYTGAFLLAVFTIPAAYQSIHVLRHHTDIPCSHHCQTEHPEDHPGANHCDALLPVAPEHQTDGYSSQQEDRKHCPIVDFRFAVNDLPQSGPLFSKPVSAEILPGHQLTGNYIEKVCSQQHPRAPPIHQVS